jgi:dihydrofolate synthase/folylpolyglutamate synthase
MDAVGWLFSLADQERGIGWNPRASPESQWKLGRTRALLDLAGAPDRKLRVALVAGTKGKGSTCAMLASILGVAGVRCGLYTKPHLQSYRERIRVDGRAIAQSEFAEAAGRMRRYARDLPKAAGEPTTFEVTTALALDFFALQNCAIGVIEVGLGGRLDATNATDPELSIITPVSYDHTAILGRTLGAIAAEKAGILRLKRPGLLAQQRPAAMRALRHACRAVAACCSVVPPLAYDVALAGAHQRQNAALAVAAARVLQPTINEESIRAGLSRLRWPGRFEVIDDRIVLDGAHNGASAGALAQTLHAFAKDRPVTLVVGINRDKDARAVLRPLVSVTPDVIATQAADNPRALAAGEVARLCRQLGASVTVQGNLGMALEIARRTRSDDGVVVVTGSLTLVGQARAALGLPTPEQLW